MASKIENLRPRSLSPTCIDTFLLCTLKYWYRYFTKEPEVGDQIHLRFGTAVHTAMEALAKRLIAGDDLTPELCDDIAINDFIKATAAQRISDPALIREGQDMIRARYNRHNPTYPIIASELNFSRRKITTQRGVPINGIIDLLQQISDKTSLVLDYKTSRRAKSPEEAKSDIQLSMYDLLVSKVYPQFDKTWLALDFLRSETVVSDRTIDERVAFENWVDQLWIKMGDQKEKDVEANINQYCPWCGYKHLCHAFRRVLDNDVKLSPVQALTSTSEFTEEYMKAKALEKIATERVSELREWATKMVEIEGVFKFEDEKNVVSWNQSSRTYYDASVLIPHIPPEDLARIVSLKNEPLVAYVTNERPDLKPLLDRATRSTAGSGRVTTRKK